MEPPEEEILRAALQSKRGLRYAPALRERVVVFAEEQRAQGESLQTVARKLGVPVRTLRRWHRARRSRRLWPVEVSSSPSGCAAPGERSGRYVLVSPSGFRVEGLGLEEIERLVRKLG